MRVGKLVIRRQVGMPRLEDDGQHGHRDERHGEPHEPTAAHLVHDGPDQERDEPGTRLAERDERHEKDRVTSESAR